jgi:HD-GYP domain-containing protein (c-di-GMP phosphodiesterase class II)
VLIRPAQRPDRQRALPSTLAILLEALQLRDPATAAHARRVAALCCHVAAAIDLPIGQRRSLYLAALCHDVGKIGIPDAILHKAGRLTLDEHLAMQQHPVIGAGLLTHHWPQLAPIVRSHHEYWDGQGYPDGLVGAQIPIASRIIAVCDGWDAMVSDRSYRQGLTPAFAAQVLVEGAGSQWESRLVGVLLGIVSATTTTAGRTMQARRSVATQ